MALPPWRRALARRAYAALLGLATPAYLGKLWLRGRAEPLYRHAIGERFGRYGASQPDRAARESWIWVHAVSLGETRAAAALIDALREALPGLRLLLTCGTATGREAGAALLREGDRQVWLPYDTAGATRRFVETFRPAVGVLMETEIWPNLLHAARANGVPVVLANARLSKKSARKGERLQALLHPAVESLALVLAQTEADAQRLRASGAPRVEVCGNLKFDMAPDAAQLERGRAWRAASGGLPIVLAASTREGEEGPLLDAWRRTIASHADADDAAADTPRPRLLIVPRHPQRFDEVAALVAQADLSLSRRSRWNGDTPDAAALAADVWLGDSMGEMAAYYAAAYAALLGGSYAPLGGQNLIEAAACGTPVVMGPHTYNFAEAAELSIAAGAARRVADIGEGVREAIALARPGASAAMARHALAFAAEHRGAAARMAWRIADVAAAASRHGSEATMTTTTR
jgi:3-deoxy-D-manno-octulosonic-acid transferase